MVPPSRARGCRHLILLASGASVFLPSSLLCPLQLGSVMVQPPEAPLARAQDILMAKSTGWQPLSPALTFFIWQHLCPTVQAAT